MKNRSIQTHPDQHPGDSHSYILRFWHADEPQTAEWRASLEDPRTRERFGFSSLEQLFAFVMELCEKNDAARLAGDDYHLAPLDAKDGRPH